MLLASEVAKLLCIYPLGHTPKNVAKTKTHVGNEYSTSLIELLSKDFRARFIVSGKYVI